MSKPTFRDPDLPQSGDASAQPGASSVPDQVIEAYEIKVQQLEPLDTGSHNNHFRIESDAGTFDLRRSVEPTSPENLRYEAELLHHVRCNGFTLGPEIFVARDGNPNVWSDGVGWTLFHWAGDGSRVHRQSLTSERTCHAARALAGLHLAASDFHPTVGRGGSPVFAVPEDWFEQWMGRAALLADNLGAEGADFLALAQRSADEMNSLNVRDLPRTVCHGDYRPANLRFDGGTVATVFDFDVAFISSRLLDLGGATTRFSTLGGVPHAEIESAGLFLKSYDAQFPLADSEWGALPAFIRWRLIRDIVVYFDRWWDHVKATCNALFSGTAEDMVAAARA
jgi:Ser/Thr protein kinase RdoA (MazF antagonist)